MKNIATKIVLESKNSIAPNILIAMGEPGPI